MARFVGTRGKDNFVGTDDEADIFAFSSTTFANGDTIDGGGFDDDPGDQLRLNGSFLGPIDLVNVRNIEQIFLGDDRTTLVVSTQMIISAADKTLAIFGRGDADDHVSYGGRPWQNVSLVFHGGDGRDEASGTSGNDSLFGDAGDDRLNGGQAGSDLLVGGAGDDGFVGGSGDTLRGGADTDFFYVPEKDPTMTIDGGAGEDFLETGDITGIKAVNVENLMAGRLIATPQQLLQFSNIIVEEIRLAAGGTIDFSDVIKGSSDLNVNAAGLKGGSLRIFGVLAHNTIIGGERGDLLVANGLEDTVSGEGGGDVLYGRDGDDLLAGGWGDDVIHGGIGYDAITGGAGNDRLTGGWSNDAMVGGAGNDTLTGGLGEDTLVGGTGDDTYFVSRNFDLFKERPDAGTDTFVANITWTLGANIEGLQLTGARNIGGTGNSLDNYLSGNEGANGLAGKAGNDSLDGGLGADSLTGGTGVDLFQFSSADTSNNADTITDFALAEDKIALSKAIFTAFSVPSVKPDEFHVGTVALTADHHLIYDDASGDLFYDSDGSGAAAAILFARLAPGLALTSEHFVIL